MSNIKYNEQEEAFELPYNIWDTSQIVRFYVDDESEIMNNLASIAEKLAKVDGGKNQMATMLIDDGYYEGGDPEALAKILVIENVYVDMQGYVHVELFSGIFEITGWVA